jgi:hypothetical protein
VRVQIGPVPAASVSAWVAYARKALAQVVDEPGGEGVWLPDDTVTTFEQFLDSWEAASRAEDPVRWSAEIAPDEAEYLSHAFFRIATNLAAQAEDRGYALAPPEGQEFYRELVRAFLDALDTEGHGSQEFAEHLRSFWPGLEQE